MGLFDSTSKKRGGLISSLHLVVQTVSTFVLTALFIRILGEYEYGIYQMVYSVASYILIIDLGISSTMTRFLTEYRVKQDKAGEENFAFHMMMILLVLIGFVVSVSVVTWSNLGVIYPSLSIAELEIGKELFAWMVLQVGLTIVSHYFQGIILSFERFALIKIIAIAQIVIYSIGSVAFLECGLGMLGIAYANALAVLFSLGSSVFYIFVELKYRIAFHGVNIKMMLPAFTLMLAMLLQSVISYVSTSVDKMLLGMFSTKQSVAVYSVAATVVTLYNALPSIISSMYLPTITRAVFSGENDKQLADYVVFAGRLQLMICLYVLVGFIFFGRLFIRIWTGDSTVDAWMYALIIMIPNTIPLIQNVTLSILDAKNKRLARSIILGFMMVVNIVLTVILIKRLGPIGAPLGTAISYLVGHIALMNVYYHKVLRLDVIYIFRGIFKKIVLAALLTVPFCALISCIPDSTIVGFLCEGVLFTIVYVASMFAFGMNQQERKLITKSMKIGKSNE